MSEISILSHEYRAAAEFSQRINLALICLKKGLILADKQEPSPEELSACRKELALILGGLILVLRPGVVDSAAYEETSRIPGALVVRLLESKGGELDYYVEDLENTAKRLQDTRSKLTEDDFQLLDDLASIASVQTSQVFHRMMRK